jgi:DHA1 family multidrug resistance protein-like MFS transporter
MTARNAFIWTCAVGFLAIFSSTMSKNPVLPLFAKRLGASAADIGFIAAASTVVGIIASLPAGALSDIWGRRRVIMLAGLVFASAPFLYLVIAAPWQLAIVRVYHGLATAIFGPVALALIADMFRDRRGETMGWYSSATLAGRALAPVVGGYLLYRLTYHAVYVGCGIAGALALAAAYGLPATTAPTNVPRSAAFNDLRRGIASVIRDRGILFVSAAEAVQYFAFGAVETFLPLYGLAVGLNALQIGTIFGAQILTTTLTKPLMGRASDRYGRRPLIAAGLIVGAAAAACIPFAQLHRAAADRRGLRIGSCHRHRFHRGARLRTRPGPRLRFGPRRHEHDHGHGPRLRPHRHRIDRLALELRAGVSPRRRADGRGGDCGGGVCTAAGAGLNRLAQHRGDDRTGLVSTGIESRGLAITVHRPGQRRYTQ